MKRDIVEAVKAYLNNDSLDNPSDSKELVKSALEQALQPILYPVYKLPEYKKYYISACVTQEKFKAL